jgi:hypothetical protein
LLSRRRKRSGAPRAYLRPRSNRGGTLIFAVDSEPANYDRHADVSFAFLHPVAPHYSTLLKFDAHRRRPDGILGRLARQTRLHL